MTRQRKILSLQIHPQDAFLKDHNFLFFLERKKGIKVSEMEKKISRH
jgi:hypothetical protein